jgi:hypothetical protein
MPQPIDDVYEIVISGELAGQEVSNVFHYEKVSASVDPFDIVDSIHTIWVNDVLPSVADSYQLNTISFRNLFDPIDVGEVTYVGDTGGLVAEALPSHDTFSIQLVHNEPTVRKGRKSIAGVTEASQSNSLLGVPVVSAFTTSMSKLTAETINDPSDPLLAIARAVVVKRIPELVGSVTRYRLPANISEAVVGYIFDVFVDLYVRTQNSRKIGRGV